MIPIKSSNLVSFEEKKAKNFISDLNADLQKLYAFFTTHIGFNSLAVGTTENYCKIDSSGTIRLSGAATVWEDLAMPLTSSRRGSNNLPDFDETNVGYLFPKNDTTEILYIIVQMPHQWKLGSTIYPHVHWCQGNSSNATFNIDYKWLDFAGSTTASFTTYAMGTTESAYVAGSTMHQLSSNPTGISGSSISNISSLFLVKLYRNDNTYPGDALTYQFDVHYEIDSLGSNKEFAK
jgi:hypothetical protein